MITVTSDQEFRQKVAETEDFELVCVCYAYLKTVCKQYGERGKDASKLIDIIEGVIV